MKKFLMGTVALAALGLATSANAADLGAKAPIYTKAPMMAAVYNWTGFYVGAHIGGAWSHTNVNDVNSYAAGGVTTVDTTGVFGGAQLGYNMQMNNFLIGIEGDIGYMGIGGTSLLTGSVSGTRVGLNGAVYGDITARLGLTFDRLLVYAKGGWAIMGDPTAFSTVTGSFSSRSSKSSVNGWTVGGGAEYAFSHNWTAKAEYQYFNFANADYTVFNAVNTPFLFNQDLTIHTVKVGINYKFGGPVVAKY